MKKDKIGLLFLISTLSLGMTVPVFGAEFTDVHGVVVETAVFGDGEEAFGVESETGVSVENDADAVFGAEGEGPDTVILDGIEYKYIPDSDSYYVVKGIDTEIVKPRCEIQGKTVNKIEENAFAGYKKIRSVDLSGGTWTFGRNAFNGCENLESIYGLNSIHTESGAFRNCPKLKSIYVNGTDYDETFAEDTFDGDTKVVYYGYGMNAGTTALFEKLRIFWISLEEPDEWSETIHGMQFIRKNNKIYLTDFDDKFIDATVQDDSEDADIIVARKAFYGSANIEDVFLKEKVTEIETKAFSHCKKLKKIIMTDEVSEIAEDAFEECPNVVIYAPKGSYALSYAKAHGIKYKISGAEKMQRPVLTYVRSRKVDNVITLKWNHIPYAEGYQVYRFNSDAKKYERIKTIKDGNKLSYKTSLRAGKIEKFKVRAYSNEEIYSEKYSPSSVRVTAKAVPDKAKIRTILTKYTNKLGVYWRQRTGADGYLLYRSEKEPYKGYKKIKYITKGSTTKYMDTGVKKGKTYYYRMRAYRMIDGKRVFGPLSDPYKVKCK